MTRLLTLALFASEEAHALAKFVHETTLRRIEAEKQGDAKTVALLKPLIIDARQTAQAKLAQVRSLLRG